MPECNIHIGIYTSNNQIVQIKMPTFSDKFQTASTTGKTAFSVCIPQVNSIVATGHFYISFRNKHSSIISIDFILVRVTQDPKDETPVHIVTAYTVLPL